MPTVVGPRGRIITVYDTTYTLRDSDNGNTLCFDNASPITVRIPLSLQIGWRADIVQQGAGVITITGQSGVTINNLFSQVTTAGQWAVVTLISVLQNNFVIGGTGTPGSGGAVTPQRVSPLSGDTVVADPAAGPISRLILSPAGTLATLTVDMTSINPVANGVFDLSTSEQITALTVNGETFLLNANSGASWIYNGDNTSWEPHY